MEPIFVPEGMEPPARDIVEQPELRVYTDDFGTRKGDNCLVAEFGGKVVGSVWTEELPNCMKRPGLFRLSGTMRIMTQIFLWF